MNEWYGNYAALLEMDHEIVKGTISKLIDSLKCVNPEWETLKVIITKPTGTPFDSILSDEGLIQFWTIAVKVKGTLKDEERHTEGDVPDHPEEQ